MVKKSSAFLTLITTLLLAACRAGQPDSIPPTGATSIPTQEGPKAAPPIVVPPTQPAAAPETTIPTLETNIITSTPLVEAQPVSSPVDEVIAALQALSGQDSFRVEQTINAPGGSIINQIDIIPPGRFRMVNPEMEMIIVDGIAFTYVEGQWLSAPTPGETLAGSYVFLKDEEEAARFRELVTQAVDAGEETLNGETVRVYEYPLLDPGESSAVDVRLWVAVADGLPRRQEMSVPGGEDGGSALITNIYKDFNIPMNIDPPE